MSSPAPCDAVIDLSQPIGSERVLGFQATWRTVWIYRCPSCGSERRLFAGCLRGKHPTPMIGGMRCGSLSAALGQQPGR